MRMTLFFLFMLLAVALAAALGPILGFPGPWQPWDWTPESHDSITAEYAIVGIMLAAAIATWIFYTINKAIGQRSGWRNLGASTIFSYVKANTLRLFAAQRFGSRRTPASSTA